MTRLSVNVKIKWQNNKAKETKPKEKFQSQENQGTPNVYTLRNPVTNKVEYAGVSKSIARGPEQFLIEQCKTKNRNTEFPINNQINGLRNDHPYYKEYWDVAVSMTSENLISCN